MVDAKIDLCVEQSICNVFPPSLRALVSDLLQLSLFTPQCSCLEQMEPCLSLLGSLFQGCGQLLSGLRRCLPPAASAGNKADLT